MDRLRLDRFRLHILPSIHENIKYLILKPDLIECILLASHYPNLTKIKLCDFNEECALHYFGDESPLRYIFQHQITNLILVNHDKDMLIKSLKTYILNVYIQILNVFQNLKHLNIIGSSNMSTLCLALRGLPSNTFYLSSLTYLSIDVYSLDDCLYLLDGRLKQLATLIVRIGHMENSSSIIHNMDHLPNLKCFSLTFQNCITLLNTKFLLLFRRLSNLENLTLYLRIKDQDKFVDGTFLQSEILAYMPLLHSLTVYLYLCHDY
ncbi:unnamed protein product [Adineta ricciae]|uniref:Uncharacterized protein n=1 Tax=Adineta ricciae TaxID=249248 RepID=A0A814V8Q8_ADIRI|nr:unnamed protein product [Adineta ricciae]